MRELQVSRLSSRFQYLRGFERCSARGLARQISEFQPGCPGLHRERHSLLGRPETSNHNSIRWRTRFTFPQHSRICLASFWNIWNKATCVCIKHRTGDAWECGSKFWKSGKCNSRYSQTVEDSWSICQVGCHFASFGCSSCVTSAPKAPTAPHRIRCQCGLAGQPLEIIWRTTLHRKRLRCIHTDFFRL